MSQAVSGRIRAMYDEQGYVIVPKAIDAELVAEARSHIEWLMAKHPTTRPENLGHTLMANDPFWVRLISDDRLLDIAQEFIGPNIALFASHYISKPARIGMPVLWHQDGSYWPLEPMEVVTLWLAVDDSTPENGCMRVIPRTQHRVLEQLVERTDRPNVLNSGMDEKLVDESQAVDVVLKAGDVSVHHPHIIHGSNANSSDYRRCGLTIRYIPTTTRIKHQPWPSSFLLRGKAVEGTNQYLRWPRFDPGQHMAYRGAV